MDKALPYELVEKITAGQQSVYKAKAKDGRLVSVKSALKSAMAVDARERFQREIEICSKFDHPNVLRIDDSGENDEVMYQVTEWLEGADLAQVFKEKRALSWDEKMSIMEQVCDGLAYAHSQGVLHRDIKPANIFVENSGRVRLLDFGMARTQASQLTVAGLSPGTLTYMSPEQVRGEQVVAASDIFCTGIVFYELATGVHPFAAKKGANIGAVLSAILFESPTPVKQVAPDSPEGLDLIIGKALEKEVSQRYESATEMKQTVQACRTLLQAGGPATAPAPPVDPGATVVIKRPKTIRGPVEAAAANEAAVAPPPAPPPPKRYCPSCTYGNRMDAAVCENCSMPLGTAAFAAQDPSPPRAKVPWVIILGAFSVVLLLFIALLLLRQ